MFIIIYYFYNIFDDIFRNIKPLRFVRVIIYIKISFSDKPIFLYKKKYKFVFEFYGFLQNVQYISLREIRNIISDNSFFKDIIYFYYNSRIGVNIQRV